MVGKWRLMILVAALAALLAACSGQAAELAKLKIGDPAPEWSGIKGVDDKEHSLADYKKAELVVLVFTCNHCPVAKIYEDRLISLQKDYKDKEVQLIAVNSNSERIKPDDSFEKMQVRAAGKDLGDWRKNKGPFNFPYIHDRTQEMARNYGALVTPHVYVLDKNRKIAYVGAVDDNNNPENAEKHHLRNALDALLSGDKPETAETRARGCTVKYEKKET